MLIFVFVFVFFHKTSFMSQVFTPSAPPENKIESSGETVIQFKKASCFPSNIWTQISVSTFQHRMLLSKAELNNSSSSDVKQPQRSKIERVYQWKKSGIKLKIFRITTDGS